MTVRIPTPRLARVRSGRVGLVLLAFVLLVALIGPLVAPHDPAQPIGLPGLPPSAGAPLGTDGLGRDVLSRVLHGGLTVIGLGIAAAAVSYLGGLTIGLAAGYSRNLLDAGLMRGVDVLLAFPPLLFVLVLVTGAGHERARARARRRHRADHRHRARSSGRPRSRSRCAATWRRRWRAARRRRRSWAARSCRTSSAPVLADFGLRFTYAIVLIASMNFLGLGLAAAGRRLGLMVAENRQFITLNIWGVLAPAIMLAVLTIAVNLIGDAHVRVLGRSSATGAT